MLSCHHYYPLNNLRSMLFTVENITIQSRENADVNKHKNVLTTDYVASALETVSLNNLPKVEMR